MITETRSCSLHVSIPFAEGISVLETCRRGEEEIDKGKGKGGWREREVVGKSVEERRSGGRASGFFLPLPETNKKKKTTQPKDEQRMG